MPTRMMILLRKINLATTSQKFFVKSFNMPQLKSWAKVEKTYSIHHNVTLNVNLKATLSSIRGKWYAP